MEALKKILLGIVVAATLTYLLKPFRFNLLDLVFLLYSLLVFSLQGKRRTASTALFVALPHDLFGTRAMLPFVVGLGSALSTGIATRQKRLKEFLKNYVVFAITVLLVEQFTNSLWKPLTMCLVPFILSSTMDWTKSKEFFREDVLFVASLFGLHTMDKQLNAVLSFLVYALLFLIHNVSINYKARMKELERFESNYSAFRKKLAAVVQLASSSSQTSSVLESLKKFAEMMSDITSFQYVLISVLNRSLGIVQRVAHYGISEQEFNRLKENPPPIDHVLRLTQERFRISNSYFIPEGTIDLPSQYVATFLNAALDDEPDAWRPDDILIVPIYNPSREMVGYISVDAPRSGKRPRLEDVQILELIADQVYKLLERSELYRDVVIRRSYDSHTLLLTHSAFLGAVEAEVAKADRFALVIMDVDDLSRINQEFGHEVGDLLLEKIADILRTRTRKTDIAARFGGEEFALLLRNVTKSKAIEIVDRLLQEIRRMEAEFHTKVSASAGIAMFPEHGRNSQELVKSATQALQIAKVSGKDRLMVL